MPKKKKDKPISIGELLFIPFVILCWILWIPCAIIKDITLLLFVPFDIQRLYDTIAACRRNLRKGFDFFRNFKSEESNEETKEQNTIGFNVLPSVFPSHDSVATGLGCVDDEELDDDME